MVECMELKLLKEAVEEMLLMNDSIIFLYQNKTICSQLGRKGIRGPELLILTDESVALLYEVLKVEKDFSVGL